MGYVPTAVAAGYLRQPEMQLPVPEPDFAKRIRLLIAAAAARPDVPGSLTARSEPLCRTWTDIPPPAALSFTPERVEPQMGETATR